MNEKLKQVAEREKEISHLSSQLKKSFFGIDEVIDEVIHSIRPWYLLPEMQTRPRIINLWGMTGVGKTALIEKLVELLQLKSQFIRVDMGERENSDLQLSSRIDTFFEGSNEERFILMLDEFQAARTINENGAEIRKTDSRIVWDLLDSGKVNATYFAVYRLSRLLEETRTLEHVVSNGVRVEKGVVRSCKELFCRNTKTNSIEPEEPLYFINDGLRDILYDYHIYTGKSFIEFEDELNLMDEMESLEFIHNTIEMSKVPRVLDCSKSLIFIIGNLDEAFGDTKNFHPDIDADIFHENSKKIKITDIRESLKKRFRAEQIARLGNQHIIYPSLPKRAFEMVISQKLNELSKQALGLYGVEFRFDPSVNEFIYKEGVIPSQGIRPLLASIQQIVSPVLNELIVKLSTTEISEFSVSLSVLDNYMHVNIQSQSSHLGDYEGIPKEVKIPSVMSDLRKNRADDKQASVAVHESGHAIASSILLNKIPKYVYSVTADNMSEGFAIFGDSENVLTTPQLYRFIQVFLAGKAAEEIVFGIDLISDGCAEDLNRASSLLVSSLRKGNNRSHICYKPEMPGALDHIQDIHHEIDIEVHRIIPALYEQVKQLLVQEKELLIRMAYLLTQQTSLSHVLLKKLIKTHSKTIKDFEFGEHDDAHLEILRKSFSSLSILNRKQAV